MGTLSTIAPILWTASGLVLITTPRPWIAWIALCVHVASIAIIVAAH